MPEGTGTLGRLSIEVGVDVEKLRVFLARAEGDARKAGKGIEAGLRQGAAGATAIETGLARSTRSLGGFVSSLSSARALVGGFFASFAVRYFIQAVGDAEKSTALLAATLRSTGRAGDFAAGELDGMADSISRLTGIDDELITGAETILLRYEHLGRDTFPRVLKLSTDLSVAMGTDVPQAARLLGMALDEPGEGLRQLQTQMRLFTKSELDSIKAMTDAGKTAEAQAIILGRLEEKVGGTAAAFRETLPGALQAAGSGIENLVERIGGGGLARGSIEAFNNILTAANLFMDELDALTPSRDSLIGKLFYGTLSLGTGIDRALTAGAAGASQLFGNNYRTGMRERVQRAIDRGQSLEPLEAEARTYMSRTDFSNLVRETAATEERTRITRGRRAQPISLTGGDGSRVTPLPTTPAEKKSPIEQPMRRLDELFKEQREAMQLTIGEAGDRRRTILREGRDIFEANLTAEETYNREVGNLFRLRRENAIDEVTFERARGEAAAQFIAAREKIEGTPEAAAAQRADAERRRLAAVPEARNLRATMDFPEQRLAALRGEVDKTISDAGFERTDLFDDATWMRLQERLEATAGVGQDAFTALADTAEGVGQRLEDSLVEAVKTGKFEIKDMTDYFLDQLLRISIRELVVDPFKNILSQGLQTAVTWAANSFTAGGNGPATPRIDTFQAHGGIIPPIRGGWELPPPIRFASGGVVHRPTLFAAGGLTGLMGEAGPEAILPLKRNASGNLGVAAEDVGGGGNVFVNIEDRRSSGARPEVSSSRSSSGDTDVRIMLRDEMKGAIASGALDRTLSTSFGLRRAGAAR